MKVASRSLLTALFFMTGTMAFAENSITGTVKDVNGTPLSGVVVKVEGTKNATVTDNNGRYSVNATPSQRLEFSYLGFVSQTLNASQSGQVVLKEDNKTLGEVVVVGYGTMRRKDVTSSITTLKQEDLNLGVLTTPRRDAARQGAGSWSPRQPTPTVNLRSRSEVRRPCAPAKPCNLIIL